MRPLLAQLNLKSLDAMPAVADGQLMGKLTPAYGMGLQVLNKLK